MASKKKSHIPMRTCIGCAQKLPKQELCRLVLLAGDKLVWDKMQKIDGRGAYICPNKSCMSESVKRKKLHKSFRRNLPAQVYDQLSQMFNKDEYEQN